MRTRDDRSESRCSHGSERTARAGVAALGWVLSGCGLLAGVEDVLPAESSGTVSPSALASSGADTTASATVTPSTSSTEGAGAGSSTSSGDGGSGGGGASGPGQGGGSGGDGGAGGSGGGSGGGPLGCPPTDRLIGHWVAEDAVGDAEVGMPVSTWPARDGVGPDLTAATPGAEPTVGENIGPGAAIHFVDGGSVQVFLGALPIASLAADAEVTIAAVLQPDDGVFGEGQAIHWGEGANDGAGVSLGGREANSYTFSTQGPTGAFVSEPGTMFLNAAVVVGMRDVAGSTRRLYIYDEGTSLQPGGLLDANALQLVDPTFAIGSGNTIGQGWTGRIAQVLVYDRALDYATRTALQECLAEQYGLAVTATQAHCEGGTIDAGEEGLGCGGRECARCGDLGIGEACVASSECRTNLCEDVPAELGGPSKQCVGIPRGVFEQIDDTFPEDGVVALYEDGTDVHALGVSGSDSASYVLDVEAGEWVAIDDGDLPPGRELAGVAHDPVGHRTWIFGGLAGDVRDDLWVWDGSAWSEDTSAGSAPAAVHGPGLGYDPEAETLVLYGGRPTVDAQSDQTYFLDLAESTPWTEGTTPAGLGARHAHALAFDDDSGSVLSVAGYAPAAESSDTFGFASAAWAAIGKPAAASAIPGPRTDPHAVRDPVRQRVVLLGGLLAPSGQTDAWEWVAGRWVRSKASGGPDDIGGRATFDPTRRRVVYVEHTPLGRSFDYYALGGPCDDADDCASGTFCTDRVCCGVADCGANVCNASASPGTCAPADP